MDKKNILEIHRLTPLQQGMLFHALSAPESGVYVEQFAYPTAGRVTPARWQQAWNLVLQAYPVLRSAIAWDGLEHPLQVIMREVELSVGEIDCRQDDDASFERRLEELRLQDATRGFDLRKAPLLRQTLLQRQNYSVLFWSHHHILLDGWSSFNVLGAVLAAYGALEAGQTWQAPPVPSHRTWLEWLKKRDQKAAEAFWRDYLAGLHAPTPLGLIELEGAGSMQHPSSASRTVTSELGLELAHTLREAARSLRVTQGTLLQAAWAYTLAIYSGENDVMFGATVSGRSPDIDAAEAMIGLFINTVPVRIAISPQESVADFVRRLQTRLLAQRAHEHASLTDIAAWSEMPRGRALFDSMLAIESFPTTGDVNLPDVMIWQQTNFPLTLVLEPTGKMRIKALYHSTRHTQEVIENLLQHYCHVLRQLCTNPDQACGLVSLCPPADCARQAAWNMRPLPGDPTLSMAQLFARQMQTSAADVAVVCNGKSHTYAELDQASRSMAARLHGAGVRPGQTVAFAFEPCFEMIVALLAITRLGCSYAPLDAKLPAARLHEMVYDLHLAHLIAAPEYAALFELPGVQVLLPAGDDSTSWPAEQDWPTPPPAGMLYVIHTSGSTGKPKAAGVYHQSFVNFVQWWNHEYGFNRADRCLLINKITFDLAQKCVWGALLTGGQLHLAPTRHFDPMLARELVARDAITWINCTPSMAYAMVECETTLGNLPNMRLLFVGGEPVDKRRLAPWMLAAGGRTELINTYGPTECTDLCTTHRFARHEFEDLAQLVTVGSILPGLAVFARDRFGNQLPLGVTGEVVIAGGSVGAGYLNNARMSAEKFLPDPNGAPGARYYLTGDLGYLRPDGTVIVRGRTDFQIKLRGYRIELDAIGAELCGHPAIRDAVALVAPDGQQLVAYVVLQEEDGQPPAWSDTMRNAVRAHLASRLPEYMVPALYVALPALPLNANGKLDRAALPAPDLSGMQQQQVAARDDIEARLHAIWQAVLGREDFGVLDNFFDLGGHSLSITQCYARLSKVFGVKIPLSVLFDQPTIAEQALALREAGAVADTGSAPQALAPTIVARPRPEHVPLSHSQSRLWFLHQYDPKSLAYNVPNALHFKGQVQRAAMQQALDWLQERHESLRTCFPESHGQPWQCILPPAPVQLEWHDLRNNADADAHLGQLATAEAATNFDLQQGPLARYVLVQGDDAAILLLTLHHIICDGWSMDVLQREINLAYTSFANGQSPNLPALPIQYADYALWQQQDLQGEKLEQSVNYWQEQLKGCDPLLTLPYDLPRPAAHSVAGHLQVSHLPLALCQAMQQVAERRGATAFMAWLALFELLLYRFSGQADFNIGSPIANRQLEETEGLVGFFVNTLVLRANIDPQASFGKLLDQVRKTAQEAYEYAHTPFELLVDRLQVPRNPAYLPLFQVGFALQRAYEDTSLIDTENWIARFDLQLVLHQQDDGSLRAHWEYSRDLFLPATIERMISAFTLLAEQVVAQAENPLHSYSTLSNAQRETMLEWNATSRPLPADSLAVLFQQQATTRPQAIALRQGETRLSYAELNQRANQLAHFLRENGVTSGELVGICLPRSPEQVITVLAIIKAGAAYLPLDPAYPQERLSYMLDNAGAKRIITEPGSAACLPAQAQQICLQQQAAAIAAFSKDNPPPTAHSNPQAALAYMMYTSGSTGKPKGVMIEQGAIVRLVCNNHYADLSPDRVWLQFAPLAFDASTLEIWGTLLSGAQLVQAEDGAQGLATLDSVIVNGKVDSLFLTSALFNQLVDTTPHLFVQIKQLLTGGEALSLPHATRAMHLMQNGRLINAYGPTECTTFATSHVIRASDIERGMVPIGKPLANTTAWVVDANLQPLPIGVPGELLLGGPGLARGYWQDPEMSARKFINCPFADGERLYRSGDRVRWNEAGEIEFLGRIDNQIKLRGFRIELGEIETSLNSYPGVQESLVMVRQDGAGAGANLAAERRLVAYILVAEEAIAGINAEHIRAHLAQHLPSFMLPAAFVPLARWPVNPNGKIDRNALPAPDDNLGQAALYEAPANEVETILAQIWGHLLRLEKVSVSANFFAIGGNSLIATQLLARVRTRLGRTITLPAFFAEPTVRAMAAKLPSADDECVSDTTPVDGTLESQLVLPSPLPPLTSSIRQVLLTGATGFLGAYLVQEILQKWPTVRLHCHVRAKNAASGMARLQENLASYGLWQESWRTRIEVLLADLAEPQLGLSSAAHGQLAADIDLIIHNASHLNHVLPYPALRRDNVEPTRHLLQLAMQTKLKGFMYVSTAGVLHGDGKGRVVDENYEIEREPQLQVEGYNASKWVAELMVRRAVQAGLPARIARLGRVVIDSQSGQGRVDDFVGLLVRTCLRIGMYPEFPLVEQIVSVDYLAKAVTALAGEYQTSGVFHLIGEDKSNWSKLLPDYVDCAACKLQGVPVKRWVDVIKDRSATEHLPFAPYLFWWDTDAAEPEEKRLKIRQEQTVAVLKKMGIHEPKVKKEAWQRYLTDVFHAENRKISLKKRWFF